MRLSFRFQPHATRTRTAIPLSLTFVLPFVPVLPRLSSSSSSPPSCPFSTSTPTSIIMTDQSSHSTTTSTPPRPVIVSDVLDTLVLDPFYNGMAAHFHFDSLESFIAAKTPEAWIHFESGQIDEATFLRTFFRDNRTVDTAEFKRFLLNTYELLPGIPHMLQVFQRHNIPVHACTNYPAWTHLIEQAVHLNHDYNVQWTFISGVQGIRKPNLQVYRRVAQLAGAHADQCIFIDDRETNCIAAKESGMKSIHFVSAIDCQRQLTNLLKTDFDLHIDF